MAACRVYITTQSQNTKFYIYLIFIKITFGLFSSETAASYLQEKEQPMCHNMSCSSRNGRKEKGVTALDPRVNDFDLMYEQVKALKDGVSVEKLIYNHVTGLLDPPELIKPPKILVIEGLHPMFDPQVRELLDFSIYLDISNEVIFAWKNQRDMAERGHSLESIKASNEARKPDFEAYIDAEIEVLPTQLIPDDNEGKILRVRLIQKEGVKHFSPSYLFDEGSTISWIPCGRKLFPGYHVADAEIEVLPTQLIPDDNEGKILRVRLIQKEGVKHFSPSYLFDEGSTISWIPCGRKLFPGYHVADAEIEVLPTQLIPDDNEGKILRVRLIQKEGVKHFSPSYLFDEGSTISWIPCGEKLFPGYHVADAEIEVLPTQLIPDDNEGKILRVRLIQKEGVKHFSPSYLFDEGSTISWIPCGRKLTCSYLGIKFSYTPETFYGHEVLVVEMDGQFDKLDELIYVESHLRSNNGTGLFQTIIGLKIRDEQIIASRAKAPVGAAQA
ncbi:hypothetical protein K1719_036827 [Acacia pycnantha]|nr:hypothetical protein K1719_036827 [Acacia pycnantha]